MDLNFMDKVSLFMKLNFSSFLTIEEALIFILIFLFLLFNLKYKNKIVSIFIPFLLLFITSFSIFLFGSDIIYVLETIVKGIIYSFYFPNIIFYIITVLISFLFFIYTIISKKLTNKEKVVNYLICGFHLYLFVLFTTNCLNLKVSLISPAKIYKHDELYVLVAVSQVVFYLNIIYQSVKLAVRKLKKQDASAIMYEKWGLFYEGKT